MGWLTTATAGAATGAATGVAAGTNVAEAAPPAAAVFRSSG